MGVSCLFLDTRALRLPTAPAGLSAVAGFALSALHRGTRSVACERGVTSVNAARAASCGGITRTAGRRPRPSRRDAFPPCRAARRPARPAGADQRRHDRQVGPAAARDHDAALAAGQLDEAARRVQPTAFSSTAPISSGWPLAPRQASRAACTGDIGVRVARQLILAVKMSTRRSRRASRSDGVKARAAWPWGRRRGAAARASSHNTSFTPAACSKAEPASGCSGSAHAGPASSTRRARRVRPAGSSSPRSSSARRARGLSPPARSSSRCGRLPAISCTAVRGGAVSGGRMARRVDQGGTPSCRSGAAPARARAGAPGPRGDPRAAGVGLAQRGVEHMRHLRPLLGHRRLGGAWSRAASVGRASAISLSVTFCRTIESTVSARRRRHRCTRPRRRTAEVAQLGQAMAAVDALAGGQQQPAGAIAHAERQRLVQAQVLFGEGDQVHGKDNTRTRFGGIRHIG